MSIDIHPISMKYSTYIRKILEYPTVCEGFSYKRSTCPEQGVVCHRAEGALRSTATSETERVSSSLCDNQTCHDVSTGDLKLMYVQVHIYR